MIELLIVFVVFVVGKLMYNDMHKRDALTAPQGTWSELGVCEDVGTAAIMSAARHRDGETANHPKNDL